MTGIVLWNVVLAVAGTAIVWAGSSRLETASRRIAAWHGIPEVVKGAVITAVASSFPELSSVVVATLVHGEFELGVAAIVGSAIFNILVIPSVAVLAGGPLRANRAVVYKDALFYIVAVVGLLLTFSLAAIYFPAPGDGIRGTLTRHLALIPVGLYAVYLFIQYHDTKDEGTPRRDTGDIRIGYEWGILAACMLAVAAGVELLVLSALSFGEMLGTPSFLWGLTIVAAGTSLPDLFISVKAARRGRSVTSLSNVLGSNSFDLLVAVPVGVLLGGATVIDFSRAAPMMGCLTAATLVLFVSMRRDMTLHRVEAIAMLALYVGFVAWMALESFGASSLLNITV
ncbi:MAG: sodium:calcium antiporter [Gammaproteobacteria bacterium]|nr:sodium:calcium antiporter [Gammaproteobacteria bacterium]